MIQLPGDWQRKPLVEALMAFKGVKLVAAMVTVSEIGTFSGFEHPKKLMVFLGLVPSENSVVKKADTTPDLLSPPKTPPPPPPRPGSLPHRGFD